MPRQFFRRITARFAPVTARITGNRFMQTYLPALTDPDLWLLNRRSVARAVAIGLVCGLIPGPLQALAAALCCVGLRGNVALALVTTFYTNPLTIVPLYAVAYEFGRLTMPSVRHVPMTPPPDLTFDLPGLTSFLHWVAAQGAPLAIGLPLLAATLGVLGFAGVNLAWRWHVVRAWRQRASRRPT